MIPHRAENLIFLTRSVKKEYSFQLTTLYVVLRWYIIKYSAVDNPDNGVPHTTRGKNYDSL